MYDRRNRYLQDRAMRKSDMARGRERDMRDYGRADYRGMYDSRMDSRGYNSEYDSRRDYRDYRDYGNEDPNRNFKYNREHTKCPKCRRQIDIADFMNMENFKCPNCGFEADADAEIW